MKCRTAAFLASFLAMTPLITAAAPDAAPMAMAGHSHAASGFGAPGKSANVTRTVDISMGDMSFAPTSIAVKQGDTVRFVLRNTSGIDHDFTLGDAAAQAAHRADMAMAMQSGHAMHQHGDGNAVTVKAGATQEMVWSFAGAGNLEYGCNVPGHYEAGMKGTITVTH